MQSEMGSRLSILSYSSVASRRLHFAWIANKSLHLSLPNIYTPLGFMSIILVLMDTLEEKFTHGLQTEMVQC